ncbi:MAG: CHAT domain-containing protein, partial [Gammaproteobacteria bacterium]
MSEERRRLRGLPRPAPAHPWLAQVAASHPDLRHEALSTSAARDATTAITVRDDDVVRVELENGFVLWTRADDLLREHGQRATARDGSEVWAVDSLLAPAGTVVPAERGAVAIAIRTLEFFGYDLTARSAKALCKALEDRTFAKSGIAGEGLHRCSLTQLTTPLTPVTAVPAGDAPVLVFIHGTFSSLVGGFGALWAHDNAEAAAVRASLAQLYGDRVYAYEHRTLTASPIENAAALAAALPSGTPIHLVTHSRGGLVGELLCLGAVDGAADFLDEATLTKLFGADRSIAPQLGLPPLAEEDERARREAYARDRAALASLLAHRLDVRRFVRVAAPARGTTLASGRLDRWLSVLNDLSSRLLPLPLFEDAMDFVFAVVKERTDPRTLPGLEAMMPGSALTRLLNNPALVADADLSAIGGDIEGASLWQRFKVLMTDWFYGAEHDLVVNTSSMTGGLVRKPGQARWLCDRGPDVDHFHYFRNARSLRWLHAGLTRRDGDAAGYAPIAEAPSAEPKWRAAVARSRAPGERRPLAVMIPGMMGSHLQLAHRHIWLHYAALLKGGLADLGWGATGVDAFAAIDDFYGPLIEFLARTHRVEIFAYDWRQSMQENGRRLATLLDAALPRAEAEQQPVHLVAHSMGGLVVRAMLAQTRGSALWERIRALPNSRFLMLGTPNRGSLEAMRWLVGLNATQGKLALLDFVHDIDEIIDIVRRFPGVLELLPFGADDADYADPQLWKRLKRELGASWPLADAAALRDARASWQLLTAQSVDAALMRYVAGCQPATVAAYEVVTVDPPLLPPVRKLAFKATGEGDGTVTWKSGRLPEVPTWYVEDTAHDNLCTQTRAFVGYLDLLMTGATNRLPASPPATRRDARADTGLFPMPLDAVIDYVPDAREAARLGFGGARRPAATLAARPAQTIEVTVRHGDLSYARHPVVVGHYLGDTIVSAERVLDRQLQRALTRRLELGIYPGRLGSHAVFFNGSPGARPKGAVVIGLGEVGELSPSLLETGATAALLEFALQVAQWPDGRFGADGAVRSAAVSCLFVGSGAAGLSIRDSIESLLRGAIAANERLIAAELNHRAVIDRIEFVELYQDIAITACDALREALADGPLAASLRWDGRLGQGRAARRRIRFDDAPEWWQRLEIVEDAAPTRALRFVFATDRARAEETMATGQLALAERFIAQVSASPAGNVEAARTLFEMLLPLRLREMAQKQQNVVLLLDAYSARFPWELLDNRWSPHGRPPAVQGGMLRQLKAQRFREQPAHADAPTALVIGNPDLAGSPSYADLPGAREEAQKVARQLTTLGFEVLDSIDEQKDAILYKLHRRAWRILHLAGHGVHDEALVPGAPPVSGMVIGPQDYLTPGDVQQLRWVPELVFVNCCHLGRTLSPRAFDRPGFAANIGVEFIHMGARAVLVAGWAVDDAAAHTFAEVFYARMLAGQYFGDAVRLAREETHRRQPTVNTWGAYQCYGDPT